MLSCARPGPPQGRPPTGSAAHPGQEWPTPRCRWPDHARRRAGPRGYRQRTVRHWIRGRSPSGQPPPRCGRVPPDPVPGLAPDPGPGLSAGAGTVLPLGYGRVGKLPLQPLEPGRHLASCARFRRLIVGRRSRQQHPRADQLEQQPRRGGAAHLGQPVADQSRRPRLSSAGPKRAACARIRSSWSSEASIRPVRRRRARPPSDHQVAQPLAAGPRRSGAGPGRSR